MRNKLAEVIADTPAYLTTAHSELIADAVFAWLREYLGSDEVVERAARNIDPEVWLQDGPIPTRSATESFHARRQQSCEIARAALSSIMEQSDGR